MKSTNFGVGKSGMEDQYSKFKSMYPVIEKRLLAGESSKVVLEFIREEIPLFSARTFTTYLSRCRHLKRAPVAIAEAARAWHESRGVTVLPGVAHVAETVVSNASSAQPSVEIKQEGAVVPGNGNVVMPYEFAPEPINHDEMIKQFRQSKKTK